MVTAGVVLAIHGGLLVLLLSVVHFRAPGEEPQFVSLWVEERPVPAQPAVPLPKPSKRPSIGAPIPLVESPHESPVDEPVVPDQPTLSAFDWHREAAAVARNEGSRGKSRDTFSEPRPEQRKRCKPKEWQFTPEEKKAGLLPLPYVVLGRCVVGLGFFGCAMGDPPEIDTKGLAAALMNGPEASVPDANLCD